MAMTWPHSGSRRIYRMGGRAWEQASCQLTLLPSITKIIFQIHLWRGKMSGLA